MAKFPLKFLTGTRKSCVNLRFVVQVKTNNHSSTTIESNTSQPFIVITNDCQWEGSEGTLLKNEAFNDQIEIPWAQFVNILQRHFLKATRQSPIQPTRPLSLYDFRYGIGVWMVGELELTIVQLPEHEIFHQQKRS